VCGRWDSCLNRGGGKGSRLGGYVCVNYVLKKSGQFLGAESRDFYYFISSRAAGDRCRIKCGRRGYPVGRGGDELDGEIGKNSTRSQLYNSELNSNSR